jgi:hypothetical protein
MKKLLFIILFSINSVSFGAGYIDGNKLHEQLNSNDAKELVGQGYILGVLDSKFDKCSFDNVVGGQLFDTVKNYLKNYPEQRQYIASYLVEKSIKEKYRCK